MLFGGDRYSFGEFSVIWCSFWFPRYVLLDLFDVLWRWGLLDLIWRSFWLVGVLWGNLVFFWGIQCSLRILCCLVLR